VFIDNLFSGGEITIHNFVAVQNWPDVFRVYADVLIYGHGKKRKTMGMR